MLFSLCTTLHALPETKNQSELELLVEAYKPTVVGLEAHKAEINCIKEKKEGFDLFNEFHFYTLYTYSLQSDAARESFANYHHAYNALFKKLIIDACKNGLFAGVTAAAINSLLRYEKGFLFSLLAAAGITLYQNHVIENQVGKVPYFDKELQKHDNLFAPANPMTFTRIFYAITIALASFNAAHYLLQ